MKTEKQIQDAINEIRRNRAEYIQTLDDKIHLPYEEQILKHQKAICETRISDLTIALELAKEKEELIDAFKIIKQKQYNAGWDAQCCGAIANEIIKRYDK